MASNEQRLLKTKCNHMYIQRWVTILQHNMLPLGRNPICTWCNVCMGQQHNLETATPRAQPAPRHV